MFHFVQVPIEENQKTQTWLKKYFLVGEIFPNNEELIIFGSSGIFFFCFCPSSPSVGNFLGERICTFTPTLHCSLCGCNWRLSGLVTIAVDYRLSTFCGFLLLSPLFVSWFEASSLCENYTLFPKSHILRATYWPLFPFSVAPVPGVDEWQSGFGGQRDWQIISQPAFSHRPTERLVGVDRNSLLPLHFLYNWFRIDWPHSYIQMSSCLSCKLESDDKMKISLIYVSSVEVEPSSETESWRKLLHEEERKKTMHSFIFFIQVTDKVTGH